MKKNILNLGKLACLGLLMYACKSIDSTTPSVSSTEETSATVQASDASAVSSNVDATINDVNSLLSGGSPTSRVEAACSSSSSFNVTSATGKATITYNNAISCTDGTNKTGTVTVELISGSKYSEKGATYKITYNKVGVKQTSNGATLNTTLNGYHLVTNVNGGYPTFKNLAAGNIVKHKIRGYMTLYFDNDTTKRTWVVARTHTWSIDTTAGYTYTVAGDTSFSSTSLNLSNVEVMGVNRFGNSFYTQITSPIIIKGKCGFFPTTGTRLHTLVTSTGTLNSSTAINTGNSGCSDGYSLTITNVIGRTKVKTVTWK